MAGSGAEGKGDGCGFRGGGDGVWCTRQISRETPLTLTRLLFTTFFSHCILGLVLLPPVHLRGGGERL